MVEVSDCANLEKIPGPLAKTMVDVANRSFAHWQENPSLMHDFAATILNGPTSLKLVTAGLPPKTWWACWRLITLLEYLENNGRQTLRDIL